MRSILRLLCASALGPAVLAGTLPVAAQAQAFTADYRMVPLIQSSADFTGAGFSLQAGDHWFGQVGMGRGKLTLANGFARSPDVVNLGAGYRFSNGQSLSLQLSQGRGPGQRLGLAVNYDWPQYFVRFSYDQGFNLAPQDNLRLSAGVRF